MSVESIVWCTTSPNPRSSATGYDAGQRGWRLHAVYGKPLDSFASLSRSKSLCGVRPRHGWGLDLFIEDPCLRCAEKAAELGLEIPPEMIHRYHINREAVDDFNAYRKNPDAYNALHSK